MQQERFGLITLYLQAETEPRAGQDCEHKSGVPTGWYYWLPPNGGNDGL